MYAGHFNLFFNTFGKVYTISLLSNLVSIQANHTPTFSTMIEDVTLSPRGDVAPQISLSRIGVWASFLRVRALSDRQLNSGMFIPHIPTLCPFITAIVYVLSGMSTASKLRRFRALAIFVSEAFADTQVDCESFRKQ